MKVYHEIAPDTLESVLTKGLKRATRGSKGDDSTIEKADQFLDDHRPQKIKEANVSRNNAVYAYLCTDTSVVDITNGETIPLQTFIKQSQQAVLELDVTPTACFVSDLDTYDALKEAVHSHQNQAILETLTKSYWDKLARLDVFEAGAIRRPEIIITYDVPPANITHLT